MLAVKLDHLPDVEVRHAVAVGHQKCAAADPRREPLEPSAGLCVQPSIHEMDGPVFAVAVVDF